MTAPSKPFAAIVDADIDPESQLTTTLFQAMRDRDQHLKEWIGGSYTAAVDHSHDGVDSKVTPASVAGPLMMLTVLP